jgi:hypothetical protein
MANTISNMLPFYLMSVPTSPSRARSFVETKILSKLESFGNSIQHFKMLVGLCHSALTVTCA